MIGIGDANALLKVYIANKPDYTFCGQTEIFQHDLPKLVPLQHDDIYQCGQTCGNGWRKVFNVYAKLVFAHGSKKLLWAEHRHQFTSWQHYRDNLLLQKNSNTSLHFTPPILDLADNTKLHLIMGKTYAKSLELSNSLNWLNEDFAVDKTQKIIICPYFDYRQLSNAKILFLVDLMYELGFKKE